MQMNVSLQCRMQEQTKTHLRRERKREIQVMHTILTEIQHKVQREKKK